MLPLRCPAPATTRQMSNLADVGPELRAETGVGFHLTLGQHIMKKFLVILPALLGITYHFSPCGGCFITSCFRPRRGGQVRRPCGRGDQPGAAVLAGRRGAALLLRVRLRLRAPDPVLLLAGQVSCDWSGYHNTHL